MSQFLQSLLDAPEPLFSTGLAKLEKNAGNIGIDTRLIADIIEKSHDIMRRLSLDTRDTSGNELYYALIATVKRGGIESLLADTEYVLFAASDGKITSLNIIDVIENMHHELSYEKQIISQGQRNLRGELAERYMNHDGINKTVAHEIVSLMGLLSEGDTWYNNLIFNKKRKEEHLRGIVV
jgi:hypothetical protein